MTSLVDREGRVFGRVNLVDAMIVVFAVLALPIAYAAFLLFRTPTPHIDSVEPAQLTYIEERASGGSTLSGKLKVHGRNLRPILRATLGGQNVIAFIFETPVSADVLFGDLPVGSHDLVLYDGVQEVARAQKAVTIPAKVKPSSAHVRVVGALIDLDEAAARALTAGKKYPRRGRPKPRLSPWASRSRISARFACSTASWRCAPKGAGSAARPSSPNATSARRCSAASGRCRLAEPRQLLIVPGSGGALRLRVQGIVPAEAPTPADVRMRFYAPAEAIDLIKVGDRDESLPVVDGRAATIASVESRTVVPGDVTLPATIDGMQPPSSITGAHRVAAIDAVVRLGADAARGGWLYRSHPLAVGRSLTFVTPRYTIRGLVGSIRMTDGQPADRH